MVNRHIQGAQARAAGEYFERLLSSSLEFYKSKGLANIEKTPEPMKILKPVPNMPGRFITCFEKQAQPDYKGTIAGGRSVVFEAKHTDADRIEASRLTQEQSDALELHSKLGALAFVVVSFGIQNVYRIPWAAWSKMKELYGRKYLKEDELKSFRLPMVGLSVVKILNGIVDVRQEVKPYTLADICIKCGAYTAEGEGLYCPVCKKEDEKR